MKIAACIQNALLLPLFLPLACFAQSPPCGQPNFTAAVEAGFIPAQQPFTVSAEICPFLPGTVVRFSIVDITLNREVASITGPINSNGGATATFGGLPSDAYQLSAAVDSTPIGGGPAQAFANFDIGGGPEAMALQGSFAFLVQGIVGATTGLASPRGAVIGSFSTDGNGNITSGEADVNSTPTVGQSLPLTGNYNLDENGQGIVILNTTLGTLTLAIDVAPTQLNSSVQSATFTTAAPTLLYGSGTLARQDPTSFAPSTYPSGYYVFKSDGETACGPACISGATPAALVSATGQFELVQLANGSPYLGATYAQTVGSSVQSGQQTSGTAGPFDGYGRSVFTFTGQLANGTPTQFADYQIDATHFYFLSLDPHAHTALLSGTASE